MAKQTKAIKLNLSEHTLDIDERKCNFDLFDFSEVEEFVKELTGTRTYQFDAIKKTLVYLWGGEYKNLEQLAKENFNKKSHIQERFFTEENFLRHLPLRDRLSGVIHMATGTGKSYVIFAIAYLSIVMKKIKRVLVLGPSSTIIEEGLRDKFKRFIENEQYLRKLPEKYRNIPVMLLDETKPAEDYSIIIENINAIYRKDYNAIGDTLFNQTDEVLVLSDEVHHAYSHLSFTETELLFEEEGGRGEERDERLWMKFLREEKKITKHIGFTGTPYNQDEYFTDIIFNYSIKDAIEEKYIKRINPIIHTESDENVKKLTQDQAFEFIYKNHLDNKEKYCYPDRDSRAPVVKPITVFIGPNQSTIQKKYEEFIKFIAKHLKSKSDIEMPDSYFENEARNKAICVISRLAESEYKQQLDRIESLDEPAEFIFAVNKLSEGWDVDNVFQIVPLQERIFNSKLLISQVLGRGLRIPRKITSGDVLGNYPIVTVTNHEKFADHIISLIDSVTECETYFSSFTLNDNNSYSERVRYNFSLFNIKYSPVTSVEERKPEIVEEPRMFSLYLKAQKEKLNYKVDFLEIGEKAFKLSKKFFTVDEIAYNQFQRFERRQFEKKFFNFGELLIKDRIPGLNDIKIIIIDAMKEANIDEEKLSEENEQVIDLYFSRYLPAGTKKTKRQNIPGNLILIKTIEMDKTSIRAGELEKETSIFISSNYQEELDENNLFVLDYAQKQVKGKSKRVIDDQLSFGVDNIDFFIKNHKDKIWSIFENSYKTPFIVNKFVFKTAQNIAKTSHAPEKEFVYGLIENAKYIDSWIKSRDMNFYTIDYEYFRKGKDRVRSSFNPDFFIKINLEKYIEILNGDGIYKNEDLLKFQNLGINTMIKVVEIKSDFDDAEETPAKRRYAEEHFNTLNQKILEGNFPVDSIKEYGNDFPQAYTFDLLTPLQYKNWFENLRNGEDKRYKEILKNS